MKEKLKRGIIHKDELIKQYIGKCNHIQTFYDYELKYPSIEFVIVLEGLENIEEYKKALQEMGWTTNVRVQHNRGQDISAMKPTGGYLFPRIKLCRKERKHIRLWSIEGKLYGTVHQELNPTIPNVFRHPIKANEEHTKDLNKNPKHTEQNYRINTWDFYRELIDKGVSLSKDYLEGENEFVKYKTIFHKTDEGKIKEELLKKLKKLKQKLDAGKITEEKYKTKEQKLTEHYKEKAGYSL